MPKKIRKRVVIWSRQESNELVDGNIRSVSLRYDLDEIKEPGRTQAIRFDNELRPLRPILPDVQERTAYKGRLIACPSARRPRAAS